MKTPVKAIQNQSVKTAWYVQDADGIMLLVGAQDGVHAVVTAINDGVFMAQVWKEARRMYWLDETEMKNDGGDPDGVDFVANRILEGAQ